MQTTREIQRLLTGLLIIMGVIGGIAAYWAVTGPRTILSRDDNPRIVEQRAAIRRGSILDRNNNRLAESIQNEDGSVSRIYHYASFYSALGYYSLQYGEGGAESAYDAILSGDARSHNLDDFFQENLLHKPRVGTDIRLTFDLAIQDQLSTLMTGLQGAAVIVSIPDGEVLAMGSWPTYNPNTLDENWETLIKEKGNPFFNRVLQGNYQPGGNAHIMLMANALLNNNFSGVTFENGTMPVHIADVTLSCTLQPPHLDLTLIDAFLYGCPSPFAELTNTSDIDQINATFDALYPNPSITLPGFTREAVQRQNNPTVNESANFPIFSLDDALGQGELTFTPIQLASITAAIINDGYAPRPYALLQTRLPGETTWQRVNNAQTPIAIFPPAIAQQLAVLMQQNIIMGNAQSARNEGLTMGGQTAIAYSGEETLVWFTGFSRLNDAWGIAIALVIENSDDTDFAAKIGGEILTTASEYYAP